MNHKQTSNNSTGNKRKYHKIQHPIQQHRLQNVAALFRRPAFANFENECNDLTLIFVTSRLITQCKFIVTP